jgi:hypothetical protein
VPGPNESWQDQKGESDDCRGTADPNRRTNTILSAKTGQNTAPQGLSGRATSARTKKPLYNVEERLSVMLVTLMGQTS